MTRLAWWLIRAQFLARRTATALSLLAIALGVSLGYAIHLINEAALADFSQAMKSVQGEPDAVLAPRDSAGGVPLVLINEIARDEAVAIVAPVIETRVRLDRGQAAVKLIGLDVFSAAALMPDLLPRREGEIAGGGIFDDGVYASPALLSRLNLKVGDGVTAIRGDARWTTRILGDLPAARPDDLLLVADIARVQAHFGPAGAVGEGRLRLMPGTPLGAWLDSWAGRLPPGLLLRAAEDNRARISNVSRAYRVNLNVLALVALLTGAFLVFATQLTSIAQRSTQFALLGVLGLSPRMRLLQVLIEGLAIGVPGAALGLGLGYALALTFTRLLGGDLGGGFLLRRHAGHHPAAGAGAGLLRPGLCSQPRRRALSRLAEPRAAAGTGAEDRLRAAGATRFRARRTMGSAAKRPVAIILLALAAAALTRLPPLFDLPLAGYAAIALVLVLGIAAAPPLTQAVFGALARLKLPAPQRVAVQNIVQAPLMAQVAASGLIVSFALTVSMVTMVSSFRVALDQWLDVVLPAPLYVRSKGLPLPADCSRRWNSGIHLSPGSNARPPLPSASIRSGLPWPCWCATWTAPIRPRACPSPVRWWPLRRRASRSGSASRCTSCIASRPARRCACRCSAAKSRSASAVSGATMRASSAPWSWPRTTIARWVAASRPPSWRSGRGPGPMPRRAPGSASTRPTTGWRWPKAARYAP
jgi:putative ABC transport system permease protein